MDAIKLELELLPLTCSECGITHGAPTGFIKARHQDHRTFWCPNGHAQHFPAESDAERLRKQLHATTLEKERAERQARESAAARDTAERESRRLKSRAKAGVCPCCNRTFKQLAAHMKNKHPDAKP